MEGETSGSKNASIDDGGIRLAGHQKSKRGIESLAVTMKKKSRCVRPTWIWEKGYMVLRLNQKNCTNSALEYHKENNPMEGESSGSKDATGDDEKNKRLKKSLATTMQKKKRPVKLTRRSFYRRLAYPKRRFLPEDRKKIKLRNIRCANSALEFYNENNPGGEFELVKIVSYNCFAKVWRRWHHLNFTAKPKRAASDSSPKLFFAEVCDSFASGPYRRCCIVDPSNFSETKPGCGYCDPEWKDGVRVYHPVGGFLRGRNLRYRPRAFLLPTIFNT